MIRPAAHAVWRAAPRRLWRTPGWLLLMLVAATLLVASVVAPPLFVATARATALDSALANVAGNPYGNDSADLRVTWDAVLPPADEAYVLQQLSALPGYGEPQVTAVGVAQSHTLMPIAVAGGRSTRSVLWSRNDALEALGADPDTQGVWLAAAVAEKLGLEVGDQVKIGLRSTFADRASLGKTVLAGTYEPAPGTSMPAAVAALPDSDRWFLPLDAANPGVSTPLAIADPATFSRLALRVHESPLYLADLVLDPDITADVATALVAQLHQVGVDSYDPATMLAAHLRGGEPFGAQLDVSTALPDLVLAADQTADSARDQVHAYAVAGQVLAVVLLLAAWVLLGRSRRREQLLASGLGLRPVEVAGLAVLEVLSVGALAVPTGMGVAGLGMVLAGPPTDAGLSFDATDLTRAALAALAAVVLVGITSGVAAAGTDRSDRLSRLGRGRRAVPWGAVLLAATGVVAFAVLSVAVRDRPGAPLTMVFPVLVAASVALVVTRAIGWLSARRPGRSRHPGTPRWLATRRSGPVVREVTALTAVVAVALGLFAYSLTVRRGIDDGVADKTAALSGAPTTLEVANDFRGRKMDGVVTPPVPGSTLVWRRPMSLPPAFGDVPLMTVDPETFADVADWGASGDLDAGRRLLPRLDQKSHGIPVIIAGDTDLAQGDKGSMDFSSAFQVPFVVVGVVPAFPGSETEAGDVTVIAGTRLLFKVLPPTVDPRRPSSTSTKAGAFTSLVWSDGSSHDLRTALDDQGIATDGVVVTATEQRVGAGLVASTWAAGYVLALGVVILLLALAGALVLALRLADRDTISDVVLRRMGYSSRDLARSRVWEAAYAVTAALVAAVLVGAVLVLAPTTIDATSAISPLTRPRPGVADAVTLAVVVATMVLLAWVVGTWRARRRVAAEVLRAGA